MEEKAKGRGYAYVDPTGRILDRSAGFEPAKVTEEIPLQEGGSLLLCGEEEVRRLREELEEARAENLAKETFLSNMSHDIRTPMNAIVGLTSLARMHIDEKARVADSLNKIETAGAHLLSLINDVLDMSRINSGRLSIANEKFYLSDLLHDISTIISPQAAKKGHSFSLQVDDLQEECFIGDALRLRQVFVNIINNSVKYTKPGGEIRVHFSEKVREGAWHLLFTCRDNGIGMSEEFLQRIFEPFERVASSAISQIEGTGLGMSIVKKLVEAMGGTIELESRVGEGTLVTICLPLKVQREAMDISALEGKKILILEGDEKLPAIYDRYLEGIRHRIVPDAEAVLEALTEAEFQGESYAAIILGRERGREGSVFDIATYLHKAHPEIVLVLIDDEDWSEIEYRAGRCGIRHFIGLPLLRKTLLGGLNEALLGTGPAGPAGVVDLTGKRILLVDDNAINREIAGEILQMTGALVEMAEDGRQAVDAFLSHEAGWYLCILMDVQMPVMDGYEAARRIREAKENGGEQVPVYAMTANTFAEDVAKARQAGMDGHIAKPIDINQLMQLLRGLAR